MLFMLSYIQNDVVVNSKHAFLLKPGELHGSIGTITTEHLKEI